MSAVKLLDNYVPGVDCTCHAHAGYECVCDADWTPKLEKIVKVWRDMPAQEMRLRCGEMKAQEIRTVRAVLEAILAMNVRKATSTG
jgi:hypothetical protein